MVITDNNNNGENNCNRTNEVGNGDDGNDHGIQVMLTVTIIKMAMVTAVT